MSNPTNRLEAISLLRFLPPGAADVGEGITREDLRAEGVGVWSDPCGRVDDLRPIFEDFDEVLHVAAEEPKAGERVIELRFKAG